MQILFCSPLKTWPLIQRVKSKNCPKLLFLKFACFVQVEESYTREALEAEEREKDLRIKVARVEEQLLSSSHSMLDREYVVVVFILRI